jgi:hypothetical protein
MMKNYLKSSCETHKHSVDEVKCFFKYFRHHAGPKALDILRVVESEKLQYNIYISSNSTLDRIEDIGCYGLTSIEIVKEIHKLLENHYERT